MTLESVKSKLQTVREACVIEESSFLLKEKVFQAYFLHVIVYLSSILENTTEENKEESILLLQSFLIENWSLVNKTMLSYTAIPESDVTLLLCDVARYVVIETNKKIDDRDAHIGLVQTLMPGIKSVINEMALHIDRYPDLVHATDESSLDIEYLLKTHVLSGTGAYLFPVMLINVLSASNDQAKTANPYFSIDASPNEEEYVDASSWIRIKNHSPLTTAIAEAKAYYDLCASDKGHLLGQLNELLFQLNHNSVDDSGEEEAAGEGSFLAIYRFISFFDTLDVDIKKTIPDCILTEIRLIREHAGDKEKHQDLSSCLATRRDDLKTAMQGHESLLEGLRLTKEKSSERIEEAKKILQESKESLTRCMREGTYNTGKDLLGLSLGLLETLDVPIHFFQYEDVITLKDLSPKEIGSVCEGEAVDQIYDALDGGENLIILCLTLSPDQLKEFCLAMGKRLIDEEEDNEAFICSADGLAAWLMVLDDTRRLVIYDAFKEEINRLIVDCESFNEVLENLPDNVRHQLYLNHRETVLAELLEEPFDASDLASFLMYLSPDDRLEHEAIIPKFITGMGSIATILAVLTQPERDRLFLVLKERLKEFSELKVDDFADVCAVLGISQIKEIAVCYPEIATFMCFGQEINTIFSQSSFILCDYFIEKYKDTFITTLSVPKELAFALDGLNEDKQNHLYALVSKQYALNIDSAEDFNYALKNLSVINRHHLFDECKARIPSWINTSQDVEGIFNYLSDDEKEELCKKGTINWQKLVTKIDDANGIYNCLPDSKKNQIYDELFQHLCLTIFPHITKVIEIMTLLYPLSMEQFNKTSVALMHAGIGKKCLIEGISKSLEKRTDEERESFLQTQENLISELLNTPENFRLFIRAMEFLGRDKCMPLLKQRLINLITTVSELKSVLGTPWGLSLDILFCEALRDQLPVIVKNKEQLLYLFNELHEESFTMLCNAFPTFTHMFPNGYAVAQFLNGFSKVGDVQFIRAMGNHWPKLIRSGRNFHHAMKGYLWPVQGENQLFKSLEGHWACIIRSGIDLGLALEPLNNHERLLVYSEIEQHIPKLIRHAKDLKNSLKYFPERVRDEIYDAVKERMPRMVTSGKHMATAFMWLSDSQYEDACVLLNANGFAFRDWKDLSDALRNNSTQQMTIFCRVFKEECLSLIPDARTFSSFLHRCQGKEPISQEALTTCLCEIFKDKLVLLFPSGKELAQAGDLVSQKQWQIIFKARTNSKEESEGLARECLSNIPNKCHRRRSRQISFFARLLPAFTLKEYCARETDSNPKKSMRSVLECISVESYYRLRDEQQPKLLRVIAESIILKKRSDRGFLKSIRIVRALNELLETFPDKIELEAALQQALKEESSALYRALDMHRSCFKVTLNAGGPGLCGFFSRHTRSLLRAKKNAEAIEAIEPTTPDEMFKDNILKH